MLIQVDWFRVVSLSNTITYCHKSLTATTVRPLPFRSAHGSFGSFTSQLMSFWSCLFWFRSHSSPSKQRQEPSLIPGLLAGPLTAEKYENIYNTYQPARRQGVLNKGHRFLVVYLCLLLSTLIYFYLPLSMLYEPSSHEPD